MLRLPTLMAFAVACTALAGCTGPDAAPPAPSMWIHVVDAQGNPLPQALVSASGDRVLQATNADAEGRVLRALLPEAAATVSFGHPGHAPATFPLRDVPEVVRLLPRVDASAQASVEATGLLGFRAPVDLLCTTPDQVPGAFECGKFGEPVVEVAGDGTIWASAVCCIGKAPPIWVSRDGGLTFEQVRETGTGLVRDAFGIEGDLAIDDAGNVYFFDISLATVWFTSYAADGTHRWTVPWVGVPVVDRPWVRAGAEDEVWIVYNTASETAVYSSRDGGRTWGPLPDHVFPCSLGTPAQGPARSDLHVAAVCDDGLRLWSSHDGGATWDEGSQVPMPDVPFDASLGRGLHRILAPTVDEAGNVAIAFPHAVDRDNRQSAVFVARRDAGGDWRETVQVSPPGLVALPWAAAGRDGHLVAFWYHAEGNASSEDEALWDFVAAASVDAMADRPHWQSLVVDDGVLSGPMGRMLGDFIQADMAPDGRAVAVYAARDATGLTNRFVSTDGALVLGPERFLNGPAAS